MPASVDLAVLHRELGLHGRVSRAAPCLEQGKTIPQHKEPGAGWGGEAATQRGDSPHMPGTQPAAEGRLQDQCTAREGSTEA